VKAFAAHNFCKISCYLFFCYCFLAPLSIAASQIVIIPAVVYWVSFVIYHFTAYKRSGNSEVWLAQKSQLSKCRWLLVPIAIWLLIAFLSGVFGIDPKRSILDSLKLILYLSLPLAIYSSLSWANLDNQQLLQKCRMFFVAFVAGQSIAALHTFISIYLGYELAPRIPGPVTESGQLVLIIPCAILLLVLDQFSGKAAIHLGKFKIPFWVFSAITLSCLIVALWSGMLLSEQPTLLISVRILAVLLLSSIAILCLLPGLLPRLESAVSNHPSLVKRFRYWILTAVIFAALIFNLKRGPWFGVITQLFIIGAFLSRRIIVGIVFSIALIFMFQPVQERWLNWREHFEISGGRKIMWGLGAELVQRYPLGVGWKNASVMRTLDPSLPELHRHMHNNLLNIAVETGWLGLFAFLAWMYVLIKTGFSLWFKTRHSADKTILQLGLFSLFITVALLGWQVAGTVEYNFGDGEVRLIALFMMGLLLIFKDRIETS